MTHEPQVVGAVPCFEDTNSIRAQKRDTVTLAQAESAQAGVSGNRDPRGWGGASRFAWIPPEVRVWLPLVSRAMGAGLLLLGIACLGIWFDAQDTYGKRLSVAPSLAVAGGSSEGSAQLGFEHIHASDGKQALPGAAPPAPAPCAKQEGTGPKAGDTRIALNVASKEELMRLPGVGQARAEAILQLRARLGRFKKLTDLLRVKGIGPKTLEAMKEQLALDPPEPVVPLDAPPAPGAAPQAAAVPASAVEAPVRAKS